ncbi:5985_t:CDS:2 [Paraglomus brasilianum]|uniref:5985_t:CDS:1 n=1 Tax=Paraglomus brasilianum TaxID=144538 RepID=A0A9N9FEU1_9GLOM|nr:5985_t:CDS:2 [Paraglomus brasilianum]
MESLASLSLNAAIEWYETDLSEDIKEFKAKKDIKNQQCAQAEFAKMKENIREQTYKDVLDEDKRRVMSSNESAENRRIIRANTDNIIQYYIVLEFAYWFIQLEKFLWVTNMPGVDAYYVRGQD